jgi:beta-N-acetylhexosaminidase
MLVVAVAAAGLAPAPADARSGKTSSKAHSRSAASGRHHRTASPKEALRARRAALAARRGEAAEVDGGKDPTLPVGRKRAALLDTDPGILERVGRHLVVGYEPGTNVKALVEKKAIGGLFITDHNVRGRSVEQIKARIDELQAIRKDQGLPPLVIAADQEGGVVSRLSPPLKHQPSIGRLIAGAKDDAARETIVRQYAAEQAAELKRIGVNMNFAPVVDLKLASTRRDDGETRLETRAIAADPDLVARIAGWYCDTLAASGILCTLKHFPGLGRVGNDTHRSVGVIKAAVSQLRVRDWVPYAKLMARPNVATMLGHVRVPELDDALPASCSDRIIRVLLRGEWGHDGILITDDFGMGAITGSKAGVGGAAVAALDAGADLILVSFSEQHLDAILTALIAADEAGRLDRATSAASAARIVRVLSQFHEVAARQ